MDEIESIRIDVSVNINNSLVREVYVEIDNFPYPSELERGKLVRDIEDMIFYWLKNITYKTSGDAWFKSVDIAELIKHHEEDEEQEQPA